jgi:amidase
VATYITRLRDSGPGLALAVKDLIDMVGLPTTAGCRALERRGPAAADALCLREIRRLEAARDLGTPRNPLDPTLMPGGSSSGSAVAVAVGDADVALGSDTGGSVRIPAACCGIAGLKTTWGRVPLSGVWPLSPSLDTVGPMARDVAGLVTGMRLLEPSFRLVADATGVEVGLLDVEAEPMITAAVSDALHRAELPVHPVTLPSWQDAWRAADVLLSAEAWRAEHDLLESDPDGVGEVAAGRIVARLPASLQLIAPAYGEELLLAVGALIEAAVVR